MRAWQGSFGVGDNRFEGEVTEAVPWVCRERTSLVRWCYFYFRMVSYLPRKVLGIVFPPV